MSEEDKIVVVEEKCIKTYVYNYVSHKLRIGKTIKFNDTIKSAAFFKNYNLISLVYEKGNLQMSNLDVFWVMLII